MISDAEVRQLYLSACRTLREDWKPIIKSGTQFYRGKGENFIKDKRLVCCGRHKYIFNNFNIIPKYCFDCYKILIVPRNVVELFKLMAVFVRINPPNDNTRKCAIEVREKISGTYMGLIYCTGLDEGNEMLEMARKVIAEEISEEIPVTMKRGCSEYAAAYPGYEKVEQGVTFMQYKEEWKIYENIADERIVFDPAQPAVGKTYNRPGFTAQEAHVMNVWLSYAATNGDLSYQIISDCELEPDPSLKRPAQFRPVFE